MNAIAGWRSHWLNEITYFIPVTKIPAMILFGPLDVPLVVILAYMATGFWNHAEHQAAARAADADRRERGRSTIAFITPPCRTTSTRTLPRIFPVFDMLFGTYCRPKPGEFPATGLASGERIESQWQGHFEPFYWRRKRPAEARSVQAAE